MECGPREVKAGLMFDKPFSHKVPSVVHTLLRYDIDELVKHHRKEA